MKELLNRQFLTLLAVLSLSGALTAPLSALLPAYAEEALKLSPRVMGALAATPMLVAGPMFLVGGALADRFGAKQTLLLGTAFSAACGLFFLLSDRPLLFGLAVVIGLGRVLHTVGSQSYLLSVTDASRLGVGSAFFFIAGFTFWNAVGSLICGPVADRWGFEPMGWGMFAGLVVVVVGGSILMPNVPVASDGQRRSLVSSFAVYGKLLARPRVRWLLAIRFLPTCTWGASTVAFPYLLYKATLTKQEPAFYTAASLIVAAFAQVLTGRLCDRLGLRWPVRLAAVALTLSCFGSALFADTRLGLWACGIAMTASAWSLSTTMPALMSTMIEPHEKGRIVGAAHVAWALGMGAGGIGGGWLLEIGPSAVYFTGCLFCVGAVVCAWAIVRSQTRPDDVGEP